MFWGIIEKSLRDVSKASAVRTGLEPATPGVTGRYSNQLNYRTNCSDFPSDGFLNGDAKIYFFLKIAILFRKKTALFLRIPYGALLQRKFLFNEIQQVIDFFVGPSGGQHCQQIAFLFFALAYSCA